MFDLRSAIFDLLCSILDLHIVRVHGLGKRSSRAEGKEEMVVDGMLVREPTALTRGTKRLPNPWCGAKQPGPLVLAPQLS
jgi:hypothetical protein